MYRTFLAIRLLFADVADPCQNSNPCHLLLLFFDSFTPPLTLFLSANKTMALRSGIGKLRTTGKSIHNYTRLTGNFDTPAINNKEVISIAPSSYSSSGHPFGFGSYESHISKPKSTTKHQKFDYHMDLGGLGPASFAIEDFNRRKNAQLKLVRVLRAFGVPISEHYGYRQHIYVLTLEAVDDGELKLYRAHVSVDSTDGMWLEILSLIVDNDSSLRLYDHLGAMDDLVCRFGRGYGKEQVVTNILSIVT